MKRVDSEPDNPAKIRGMYRDAVDRNPTPKEMDTGVIVSGKRNAGAVRAGAAGIERGDFLAMSCNHKHLSNERLSRREWIGSLTGGLGALGLAGCCRSRNCALPRRIRHGDRSFPTFPPKAKNNIVLFMVGGPSQLDMFDPKPSLLKYQGQRPSSVELRTERTTGGLLPSPFEFKQYGRGGVHVSSLLPNLASTIDDICVIKSMYTFNPTHTPARSLFHTGNIAATRPSMGAWISYGLGSENKNLPGFVVLGPGRMRRAGLRAPASCRRNIRGRTSTIL